MIGLRSSACLKIATSNNYPEHKYRDVYILSFNIIEHRLLMCRENNSTHLSGLQE